MPRHDVYRIVHKALRAMMYDFSARVARVDPLDDTSLRFLSHRLTTIYDFLGEHAQHEEDFIHPLLQACDNELCQTLVHTHHGIDDDESRMQLMFEELPTLSRTSRIESIETIRMAFDQSLQDHLAHFALEEQTGNQILWANYDDGQILEAHLKLQQSIKLARFGEWFDEMIPSMNANDLAEIIVGLRADPSDALLNKFETKLVHHLGEVAHRKLLDRAQIMQADQPES